jgi:hypothetical protein
MLLINYIFTISSAFAFTDYFANVDELYKVFKNGNQVDEVGKPDKPQQISSSGRIQVISTAVHGKTIESQTEVLAKKLFDKVVNARKNSALYSFLSNINSTQSGNYYTGRCIPTHCCKKIEYLDNKVRDNKQNYGNGSTCKSFKVKGNLKEKEVCKYKEVCYLNAGHITSENFMTKKLNEILPNRYPVSFHGYQDRSGEDGKLVHIVLGGLSNQKYKLAETYHKSNNGAFRVAVCKTARNCRIYDPSKKFEQRTKIDGSGLTGTSTRNFVNKGRGKCGLQIELSGTYRDTKSTKVANWDSLIESIIRTIPNNDNEICDPERPKTINSEDKSEF